MERMWEHDGDIESIASADRSARARPGGARSLMRSRSATAIPWRLTATLLAAGVLAAAIVATGSGPRPIAVVVPSERPNPTVAAVATLAPVLTQAVYDTGFGFTINGSVDDPWASVVVGWGGHAVEAGSALDFRFGACPYQDCALPMVSVGVGTVEQGVIVGREYPGCPGSSGLEGALECGISHAEGGKVVTVRGRTTEELAAAWSSRYATVEPQWVWLSGVRWAILDVDGWLVAFATDGDRMVSVTAQPGSGLPTMAVEARFRTFVAGVRFTDVVTPH
jgi:hypothetical protein